MVPGGARGKITFPILGYNARDRKLFDLGIWEGEKKVALR